MIMYDIYNSFHITPQSFTGSGKNIHRSLPTSGELYLSTDEANQPLSHRLDTEIYQQLCAEQLEQVKLELCRILRGI